MKLNLDSSNREKVTSIQRGSEEIFELLTNIVLISLTINWLNKFQNLVFHKDVSTNCKSSFRRKCSIKIFNENFRPSAVEYNRILDEMKRKITNLKTKARNQKSFI